MEPIAVALPVSSIDLPSGSGWNANIVKSVRFASKTAKTQLEDFDQILDICFENLGTARPDLGARTLLFAERDFGRHVPPETRLHDLDQFYEALKELKNSNTRELSHTGIPDTRSMVDKFQSSPISVNPNGTPQSDRTALNTIATIVANGDNAEKMRDCTSDYPAYVNHSDINEKLSFTANQTSQASHELEDDPHTPEIPKTPEMALSVSLCPVPDQPPSSGGSAIHVPSRFVDVDLSSSQEASTYYDESSPTHPSEDSSQQDPAEKDQDEENTNFMMRVLLNYICIMVGNQPEFRNSLSDISCNTPSRSLRVNIGGQVVKTKPDLQIVLQKGTELVTIVDYEGKRLKGSSTIEEKYGQQVCHLLGRAADNSARGRHKHTAFREVFLIAAHHTSVSILTCQVKQAYLRLLAEGLESLEEVNPPREVFEYGPVDLNNPGERVLFVKSIYRLIDFLCSLAIQSYFSRPDEN